MLAGQTRKAPFGGGALQMGKGIGGGRYVTVAASSHDLMSTLTLKTLGPK